MKKKEKAHDVTEQFEGLVNNAIEFLERAIEETSDDPKHAIIDFYTSLELFIKARLMKEHWTLILSKPGTTKIDDFIKGDFQSISLVEANTRLSAVLNDEIGKEIMECFDEIRKHRNRLIHFHNKTTDLRELVTKEVLRGLYYLQILIQRKWFEQFESYKDRLTELSERSYKLRDFLNAKYDILAPRIDAEIANGSLYTACLSCSFPASRKRAVYKYIFSSKCEVCDMNELVVRLDCPNCKSQVFVKNGEASCEICDHQIDIDSVIELLEPEKPLYGDGDAIDEYNHLLNQIGRCGECGWLIGSNTLHPMDERLNAWFCIGCGEIYEHLTNCTVCGVLFPYDEDWGLVCPTC